jgi:malonyl-CoA O-methyltransferase
VTTLSAREGYRLWAPRYETETAVSYLEDQIVAELGVQTSGRALLDVGCGTGRRMRESDAAIAVGIDLAPEMLRVARESVVCAAGDVRALPLAAASFDVIWCRLMIGHVADVAAVYAELSRVCRDGGVVVVSDIGPEAVAAGHRRTFRDAQGVVREVEHFVHSLEIQVQAAGSVGLSLETQRNGIVGSSIESFYAPNRLEAYGEQRGLRLVHALSWRKRAVITSAARDLLFARPHDGADQ